MPLEKTVTLYPGYLFVVEPINWRSVKELEGVIGPLEMADAPAPLKAGLVEALIAGCAAGEFDNLPKHIHQFVATDRVSPSVGPMFGRKGTIEALLGKTKARVLFDKMDRSIAVPLDILETA